VPASSFKSIQWTKIIRTASAILALALLPLPAVAQWSPWANDAFGERRGRYDRYPFEAPQEREPSTRDAAIPPGGARDAIQHGGARPVIAPQAPPVVSFPHAYPAASIVIDASMRRLYYVLAEGRAYEYPISVGREGFNWTGNETISRKQEWPDWHPPEEMRQRDPKLPEKMTGGIRNPLGAVALYLGDTLYRIHGTNDVKSIGQAQSSGCFRMMNSAVVHLASLVEIGTPVAVVAQLPQSPVVSRADDARQQATLTPPPSAPPDREAPMGVGAPASGRNYHALREYMMGR
jgi:lipoprotein-anchoring transpeptidase ErfK/SrfK